MTLTEQVKILDDKIKENKAQYELHREATKISVLSRGELEKYEYLTGEDLGYKPGVAEKAKCEYSPLGKIFNKGLDESDKKERVLKRLENFESKNEQQLEAIKDQGKRQLEAIRDQGERQLDTIKSSTITNKSNKIEFNSEKNQEAKELVNEVYRVVKENKNKKFVCAHSNGTLYDFNEFRDITQFGNDICNGCISTEQPNDEQNKMEGKMTELENYNPKINLKKTFLTTQKVFLI